MLAAQMGQVDVAEQLVDGGASLDSRNLVCWSWGDTQFLGDLGYPSALDVVRTTPDCPCPLPPAPNPLPPKSKEGEDVSIWERGESALMHAAHEGHSRVVQLLIRAGAEIDRRQRVGPRIAGIADERMFERLLANTTQF